MALDNFILDFTAQTAQNRPIRQASDKWYNTPFGQRMRFEVSEGIRPAEYFAVDKYAPVCLKDKTTEDYIVLPKGRLVSAVAIPGSVAQFKSTKDGSTVAADSNTSSFGYDTGIVSQLVLANGGVAVDTFYSAEDEAAGTYKSLTAYAVNGDAYSRIANVPVGAVFHDWYQDLRGKYLNYKKWADGGHVLTEWYVEVPFIVEDATGAKNPRFVNNGADVNAKKAEWVAKYGMNKKFTYLSFATGVNPLTLTGTLVQSDLIGNYIPQAGVAITNQTVGKILAVDTRFPKSGLEDVQTYPGSGTSGTQTAGIPAFLFEFAIACESLAGNTPTIESVSAVVKTGKYGIVRIKLDI